MFLIKISGAAHKLTKDLKTVINVYLSLYVLTNMVTIKQSKVFVKKNVYDISTFVED